MSSTVVHRFCPIPLCRANDVIPLLPCYSEPEELLEMLAPCGVRALNGLLGLSGLFLCVLPLLPRHHTFQFFSAILTQC